MFEPAGSTAHPQVARAAAAAGIGVVVLNRETDYIAELRRQFHVPTFAITSNHEEIGRIQGHQLGALLPGGGNVLYIQGPAENSAAKQRYTGLLETKSDGVQLRVLKAQWTEASAHKAVSSWLRLSTSRQAQIEAVCAQDDSMAMGARKAFEECDDLREQLLKMPFLGCDGLPKTGQEWVRNKQLAATIFIPPNADLAIEMMVKSINQWNASARAHIYGRQVLSHDGSSSAAILGTRQCRRALTECPERNFVLEFFRGSAPTGAGLADARGIAEATP